MTRALLLGVVLALCSLCATRPARQLLPPKAGYVPVYIRNGDTPLEEINLDLAEAFHAIPSGRSAGRTSIKAMRSDDQDEEINDIPDVKIEPAPVSDFEQDAAIVPNNEQEPKQNPEIKSISDENPQQADSKKADAKAEENEPLPIAEKIVSSLENKPVNEKNDVSENIPQVFKSRDE